MIRIVNSVREVFGKCSAFLRVQRSGRLLKDKMRVKIPSWRCSSWCLVSRSLRNAETESQSHQGCVWHGDWRAVPASRLGRSLVHGARKPRNDNWAEEVHN